MNGLLEALARLKGGWWHVQDPSWYEPSWYDVHMSGLLASRFLFAKLSPRRVLGPTSRNAIRSTVLQLRRLRKAGQVRRLPA